MHQLRVEPWRINLSGVKNALNPLPLAIEFPHPNRSVVSGRGEEPVVGGECEAVEGIGVAFQGEEVGAGAGVVEAGCAIRAAGGEVIAAGGKQNAFDELRMAVQRGRSKMTRAIRLCV